MAGTDDASVMDAYSKALDEIYRLRQALAFEASVVEAHLTLKSFPKSRRRFAEGQVERMQEAARGEVDVAYAGMSYLSMRHSMDRAKAKQTLTRAEWEAELGMGARAGHGHGHVVVS